MKDRPLFDKVSLGIAIVSAIFAGLSFFSQIGLLGGGENLQTVKPV